MTRDRPRCDIFLSHNRLDRDFVREVAEGLELEFGIPHFLDEYAIPPLLQLPRPCSQAPAVAGPTSRGRRVRYPININTSDLHTPVI